MTDNKLVSLDLVLDLLRAEAQNRRIAAEDVDRWDESSCDAANSLSDQADALDEAIGNLLAELGRRMTDLESRKIQLARTTLASDMSFETNTYGYNRAIAEAKAKRTVAEMDDLAVFAALALRNYKFDADRRMWLHHSWL